MLMFCIHENRAIILAIKTRKPLETLAVFGVQSFRPHVLAEDEGFEPPQTESESGVLPLHKSSIAGTFIIIRTFLKMSRSFLKFFQISDEGILPAKKATYSSQGKGFPGKTWCFKYRKVFSSPSSRSMVSKKSSSCLVWGCIQLRSALRIKYS